MNSHLLSLTLSLLSPIAVVAVAQDNTHEFVINVREKGSGNNVRRAALEWDGQRTFADKNGRVTLRIPNNQNKIKVKVSRPGYVTQDFELDTTTLLSEVFLVSKQTKTVIVVTGKEDETPSQKQISIEEAKKVAPSGDPANIVKVLPGVQVQTGFGGGPRPRNSANVTTRTNGSSNSGTYLGPSPSSNSGVVVRGSPADDTRYYVDDFEVPFVFHNIIDLSIVPGTLLSDVQFDAGGFGTRFGNAGGGVIRLNTRSDTQEKFDGEAIVNLPFYASLFFRSPAFDPSQSWSASYRRSYLDLFIDALLQRQAKKSGVSSFSIAPVAQDAHLMYTQKTATGTRKILALYAEDGIKLSVSKKFSQGSDQSLSLDSYTRGFTIGVQQDSLLSETTRIQTTPQLVYTKASTTLSGNVSLLTSYKLRAPTEFEFVLNKSNTLFSGIDPEWTWMKQDTEFNSLPFFSAGNLNVSQHEKFQYGTPAVWTSLKTNIDKFTFTPGLRVFYNSQIKKTGIDPRFNATYKLDSLNTLKGAIGRYSRAPNFEQASRQYGNSSLTFENTYHYILGVETAWNDAYTTDVQIFLKEGYKIVQPDLFKKYVNDGRREVYGLEVFARRNLTDNFFGWVSYTYSKTIERYRSDQAFRRSPLDQAHIANVVANYRFTPVWEGALRYKYSTGGTYIPSRGGIYDTTRDSYTALSEGAEEELPANQSFTFYATREYLMETWKLSLRFGMESFWFSPIISSMRSNYDKTKDTKTTSLSNIPFLELKGTF